MQNRLRIWSNGASVGIIEFNESNDLFSLTYDQKWIDNDLFLLSPRLKFDDSVTDQLSVELRRFLENLLPEGEAFDEVAALHQLSKSNIFGIIHVLGKESAGALSFLPDNIIPENILDSKREISAPELSKRIRSREQLSFSIWDGKVRMSIAGFQDKIAVYREEGTLFLVEGSLASTHILKPIPRSELLKHLVINEFFCMSLAEKIGLDVAKVEILRVPEAILVVERFDRKITKNKVSRIHIIDGCQALGMPPRYKYERIFGDGSDVQHVRNGVSFPRLFSLISLADNKAIESIKLLRWSLFQFLIGNVDAHGKNISYFVESEAIRLAPAYDLVAGEMHDCYSHDISMGIGDEFRFTDVGAFDWAEFGATCGIKRELLEREMVRIAKLASKAIDKMTMTDICVDQEESDYLSALSIFIKNRALKMEVDARLISDVDESMLSELLKVT